MGLRWGARSAGRLLVALALFQSVAAAGATSVKRWSLAHGVTVEHRRQTEGGRLVQWERDVFGGPGRQTGRGRNLTFDIAVRNVQWRANGTAFKTVRSEMGGGLLYTRREAHGQPGRARLVTRYPDGTVRDVKLWVARSTRFKQVTTRRGGKVVGSERTGRRFPALPSMGGGAATPSPAAPRPTR